MIKVVGLILVLIASNCFADQRFIYFSSKSCGACKQQDRIITDLEKEHTVRRVDVSQEHDFTKQMKVQYTPTVIIVECKDNECKEVKRHIGVTSKEVLLGGKPVRYGSYSRIP